MRRFKDRFERTIQLKEPQLRQLEVDLNRQRQIVTETRNTAVRLHEELSATADAIHEQTSVADGHSLWIRLSAASNLKTQLGLAHESLRKETVELQRRQAEYARLSSQLEALKVVQRQRMAEHRAREGRARQREMDDMAMSRWSRTMR